MTKDVLKGSRSTHCSTQQKMVADLAEQSLSNYEMPATLEAAACIFSQYFSDSQTCLYPRTYTHCQESAEGHRVIVGAFDSAGLTVDFSLNYHAGYIGVASLRKF